MSDDYGVSALEDLGTDRLKLLLHGEQGKGKTALAASIAEKCKTVIVDLPGEKGLKTIKGVPYSKNIKVIRPTEVGQLDDIFWDLQTDSGKVAGTEAVVVESASAYQKMLVRMVLGNPEDKVRDISQAMKMMDQQKWGKVGEYMQDLATFWYGLADIESPNPIHVVMTSQSRIIEDEETGERSITPDVTPASRAMLLAAPDYIGYCFVERGETEDLLEEKWEYKVRFGPHDIISTKIHETVEKSRDLPPIFSAATFKGKDRVTIPLLCHKKIFDIPLA